VFCKVRSKTPIGRHTKANPQSTKGMQGTVSEGRSSLIPRLWLTGVVIGQILITPMAAFSITYLFAFSKTEAGFSIDFQQTMIPWIISASLTYGMIALALALLMGGFMPRSVVRQGGWLRATGIIRGRREAEAVARCKMRQFHSPQGRMTRMINNRYKEGYGLISIHGGLVLLAIPFQLVMVVLPLATILLIPEGWMAQQRVLEFALISYITILIFLMQIYPKFANKFVTIAAFTRRWLISMTRLSWLAPILVLWLLGRLASLIVITWIGPDIGTSIAAEKAIFEDWLNIGSVPENSFLDLLTALAVMPLSAFTTLTVLGGGGKQLPDWLLLESDDGWKSPEGEDENGEGEINDEEKTGNMLERGVDIAAGTAAGVGMLAGGALLAGQSVGNLVSGGGEGEALGLEPAGSAGSAGFDQASTADGDTRGGSDGFAQAAGPAGASGTGGIGGGEAMATDASSGVGESGGAGIGTASENGLETDTMMSMFERFD